VRARLVRLLRFRRHTDRALDDDVAAHLDLLASEFERRGLSPVEARHAARRAFGGLEQMKEEYRDARGWRWIDEARRDVHYALRMLARSRGFTAVAVLTLALGIGASTALFSVVYDYVFRTLPVRNPGELVTFRWIGPQDVTNSWSGSAHIAGVEEGQEAGSSFSFAMLGAFHDANRTLSDLVAFAPVGGGLNVFTGTQAEQATGMFVSGNFYSALGVAPVAGRVLAPNDDRSAAPVAVISEAYWRRRFARSPDVLGRVVTLNNVPVTVVGVVSAAGGLISRGFFDGTDFSIPLALEPRILGANSMLVNPANWWVMLLGRLRPGMTPQNVHDNFAALYRRTALAGWQTHIGTLTPEQRSRPSLLRQGTQVPRLQVVGAAHGVSDLESDRARQLMILGAVFAAGLAIVCLNLTNLLLARTAMRQREIAVRLSVGATRVRIVRQLLVESLVLGVLGAVVAWPVAIVCRALTPPSLAAASATIDWPVMVFAGGLAVVASLVVGIIPAVQMASADGTVARAARARQTTSWRVGKPLIVAQVALSLVLLIGAALLIRTLLNLQRVPLGFDAANLVLFELQPGSAGYDRAAATALYSRLGDELRRIPGVRAVSTAGAGSGMLWGTDSNGDVVLENQQPSAGVPTEAKFQFIDVDFFSTMGLQLRQGRPFTPLDTATSLPVAVVNEAFVKAFFGGANALGRRFAGQADAPAARLIEIVGVVNDVRVASLRRPAPPMFYRPIAQTSSASRTVIVRTTSDTDRLLPAIAAAAQAIDPRLPLRRLQTQADYLRRYTTEERVLAAAAGASGGLSLLVSMIGLFGLMSYAVTQRTKEIGIRMAIGADPAGVLTSVMKETMTVVCVGVAVGLPVGLASARMLAAVVYDLSLHDPASVASAIVLMVSIAAAAAVGPARRASRVDPAMTLRAE
jgi:predicted permease